MRKSALSHQPAQASAGARERWRDADTDRGRASRGEREFVPAVLTGTPTGGYECQPSASSLVGLAEANALAVVPEGIAAVNAGDLLDCLILDG